MKGPKMSRHDGYHTALNDAEPHHKQVDRAEFRDGVALRYDLFEGYIPPDLLSCDVFYSDLPWRSGFEKFEVRAGCEGRNYNDFLDMVQMHIKHMGKPAVMITDKHAITRLCPDRVYPTKLNGDAAVAACWNIELGDCTNERTILAELARRYDVAGDFCCGHGRTAWFFRDAGKRFVVSDYNASCIGYIADKMGVAPSPELV
jgi:hypothetical protein